MNTADIGEFSVYLRAALRICSTIQRDDHVDVCERIKKIGVIAHSMHNIPMMIHDGEFEREVAIQNIREMGEIEGMIALFEVAEEILSSVDQINLQTLRVRYKPASALVALSDTMLRLRTNWWSARSHYDCDERDLALLNDDDRQIRRGICLIENRLINYRWD